MKRFFLHVLTDTKYIEDVDGCLFRNLDAAILEAVASVREVAASLTNAGVNPRDLRIDISDEAQQALITVSLADVLH